MARTNMFHDSFSNECKKNDVQDKELQTTKKELLSLQSLFTP